jgi:hypothetical protein
MVHCHHIIIISPAFCSHFHSVCCPRPSRWGCRSIHPANPTSARKIGRFLLEFCHYWHQYPAKKLVRLMLSAFDCPTDIINIYIYIQYILYICMIYMFVYCSTCLQSPSSATTPRSDSLEGDRSPSVKKKTAVWILNGVLKSSSMLNSWLKNIDCTVEFIERSRFSQNCTCEPMNMRNQLWMWLAKIGLAASAMIIFLFLMQ